MLERMAKRIPEPVRPNVVSLGYALFLAVNATGVWGGVFPFLPASIQTADILFWFYLALSLALFGAFLIAARMPSALMRMSPLSQVLFASITYFCGWASLIAAMYVHGLAFQASVIGGAFLGIGSGSFYLLWQRLFASSDYDTGLHNLIVGFAYAALIYFALYLLPRAVTAYLVPAVFLPLFALALVIGNRTIDNDQPMFSDLPSQNKRVYRSALATMWRSALCMGAIALCTGATRAAAIENPSVGSIVNVLSMGALLAGALTIVLLWTRKGLRSNIVKLYKFVFPVLISAFVVLPFAGNGYMRLLAASLYALYSIGLMLTMLQCAQISRDRGVHPFFAFGAFGGIVYALHDIGFILGSLLPSMRTPGIGSNTVVALFAVYLLALMFFIGAVNFKDSARNLFESDDIELFSPNRPENTSSGSITNVESTDGVGTQKGQRRDVPSNPSDTLRQLFKSRYQLSDREVEVARLVAQGQTVARIADELCISENTVRTHKKRIYSKLGVHKKQELADLVKSLR